MNNRHTNPINKYQEQIITALQNQSLRFGEILSVVDFSRTTLDQNLKLLLEKEIISKTVRYTPDLGRDVPFYSNSSIGLALYTDIKKHNSKLAPDLNEFIKEFSGAIKTEITLKFKSFLREIEIEINEKLVKMLSNYKTQTKNNKIEPFNTDNELFNIKEKLGLSSKEIETTNIIINLFKKTYKKDSITREILYPIIYAACRKNNVRISMEKINQLSKLPKKILKKTYRLLIKPLL